MDKNTYLQLLKKYLNENIKVGGIEIYPDTINDDDKIIFKINNPDDISYTKGCLMGYMDMELNTFNKLICFDLPLYEYEVEIEDCYVSPRLKEKIGEHFKGLNKLYLPVETATNIFNWAPPSAETKDDDRYVEIQVEHLCFDVQIGDDWEIKIVNNVKPIKGNTESWSASCETSLTWIVEMYNKMNSIQRFYDSEYNYESVDTLLENEIAFHDLEWQLIYTTTQFVS